MNKLLRSTIWRSSEFMVTLFVSHIQPTIDFCTCVWNFGYLGDIRLLESLQRRWPREVVGMGRFQYREHLEILRIYSVHGRLFRAILVKIWKFNSETDIGVSCLFERAYHAGTRGHSLKFSTPRCRSETPRRSFASIYGTLSLVRLWIGSLWLGSIEVWMRACGTSSFIWVEEYIYIFFVLKFWGWVWYYGWPCRTFLLLASYTFLLL